MNHLAFFIESDLKTAFLVSFTMILVNIYNNIGKAGAVNLTVGSIATWQGATARE